MKKLLRLLGVVFLILIVFVIYVISSTGFFRSIENSYSGAITQIEIPGAEDFAIDREDGFMIISSADRAGRRDGKATLNGLYYMDLNDGQQNPQALLTGATDQLYPHGISLLRLDSNTHRLLVINHLTLATSSDDAEEQTTHQIDEYILRDQELNHVKTYTSELMISPNDVVAIDEHRFYYTNDHGSLTALGLFAEDYLGLRRSHVAYYNGADYRIVAEDIAYANGINYDQGRKLLYVSSPRDFLVKVYHVNEEGKLNFQTDVDCNSGVDNIELDADSKLWIGSHPKLLSFSAYAGGGLSIAPSEIITIDYQSKDQYTVESLYESDGSEMSASTVAIPYRDKVYLGNVMDDHFIVLDHSKM